MEFSHLARKKNNNIVYIVCSDRWSVIVVCVNSRRIDWILFSPENMVHLRGRQWQIFRKVRQLQIFLRCTNIKSWKKCFTSRSNLFFSENFIWLRNFSIARSFCSSEDSKVVITYSIGIKMYEERLKCSFARKACPQLVKNQIDKMLRNKKQKKVNRTYCWRTSS